MRNHVFGLIRHRSLEKQKIKQPAPSPDSYMPGRLLRTGRGKKANGYGVCPDAGWDYTRKSPLMIGAFLLLWMTSITFNGPRLWQILITSGNIVEAVLLAAYCAMLLIFWLLAAYYVAVVLFSFFAKPLTSPPVVPKDKWPKVAILYPTCNDFQVEAALSCLNQDYSNFHLFLLDDSTRDEFRTIVEAFHTAHPERTTVVWRPARQGFKAGNLNRALRGAAASYPFFAVVDADERLPTDFLRRTMAYMIQDSRLAFVQANHAPNPQRGSAFASDIGPTIIPFWDVHCRPRNRYGFVLYLGHGAVVRRRAWEVAGGFPEVVLEDLAFSAILGEIGLRGAFLEDLLCFEDFPNTYPAFKRQHERYIIGATQVMHRYLGRLLRSQRVSLTEKIDFCLWCSPLYVPALCLIFVILCSLGLAAVLGDWGTLTISILGHQFDLSTIRVLDERFTPLWTWEFQIFSVLSAFAPTFACLALGIKGKLRAIRLLFLSTVPYLSVMLVSWRGILGYLLLGRTFSPPTGEPVTYFRGEGTVCSTGSIFVQIPERAFVWRAPRAWEILLGGVLTVASLMSFNIALSAICCCLLVGNWIEASGWEKKPVRIASIGCFAVILLQMFINVALLVQSPGLVPLVFSVHF